jgi:hypothetical protein
MTRASGRSDPCSSQGQAIVDIEGEIREPGTALAVQFYDGERTVWLPRSQIEINDDGTVSMPEWLAMEKGLI